MCIPLSHTQLEVHITSRNFDTAYCTISLETEFIEGRVDSAGFELAYSVRNKLLTEVRQDKHFYYCFDDAGQFRLKKDHTEYSNLFEVPQDQCGCDCLL